MVRLRLPNVSVLRWIGLWAIGLWWFAVSSEVRATTDFAKVDSSVVRVVAIQKDGMVTGSGFVIERGGTVITSNHVVANGVTLVILDGGIDAAHMRQATIRWRSRGKDIAILDVPALKRPPLILSAIPPNKGDRVFAIGFPGVADKMGGLENIMESTMTDGIVGRLLDTSWAKHGEKVEIIQHSAQITPGNSGGPLLNSCYQVVGINTAIARDEEADDAIVPGMGYSGSIRNLIPVLQDEHVRADIASDPCTPSASSGGTAVSSTGVSSTRAASIGPMVMGGVAALALLSVAFFVGWVRVTRPTERPRDRCWRLEMFPHAGAIGAPLSIDFSEQDLLETDKGLVVGRTPALCHRVIQEDSISRRHVRFFLSGGQLALEDLNTLNGTMVNQVRALPFSRVFLGQDAEIMLGKVRLRLTSGKNAEY